MTSKLLSLLLSTLILACPFNCMPENGESTETVSHSCCSHCQSKSEDNPLSPPATDCCQCFCDGAIIEASCQIDLTLISLVWGDNALSNADFQFLSLNSPSEIVLLDPGTSSGRQIRCLQMSFQC